MQSLKIFLTFSFLLALLACKKEETKNEPTEEPIIPISSFENINLGNHNNLDYGSFINLKTGEVYKLSTAPKAFDNQNNVDLIYYYNNINHTDPFIGAPTTVGSNNATGGIYDNNPDGVNFWTTENNTEFGLANDVSIGDFNTITNLSQLKSKWGTTNVGLHYEYNVKSEKVYRFKTSNNKIGFLKINSIIGSGQTIGTMNVNVKIQK